MDKSVFIVVMLTAILTLSGCSNAQVSGNMQAASSSEQGIAGIDTGDIPPDFTITTIDGKELTLNSFRGEKPILLYFFASWCPYCSQDFDVVKGVYPKFADNVELLAIDLDLKENKEIIAEYRAKKGLTDVHFAQGKTSILSDYSITHTTTKYAIGKNGKILYKGSGVFTGQQWNTLFSAMQDTATGGN